MHAWESIQKTIDFIEENIDHDIQIESLAEIAALSLFYYQRLFTRLVKKPVREYIKLRRLDLACTHLRRGNNHITDIAAQYGFGSRETFSRAFKDAYGLSPSEYRDNPVGLESFAKPNLLLNYVMVDEGVPLITEGVVLEFNRKTITQPINFLGTKGIFPFKPGKMLGEKTGVSGPAAIWDQFFSIRSQIPLIPHGRGVGVTYNGGAPEGYTTYFAGAEVEAAEINPANAHFAKKAAKPLLTADGSCTPKITSWQLPAREYIVCEYEAEDFKQLMASMGKMMKFARLWLKNHGLIADGFFPEIYYNTPGVNHAYMEMWIPFKERERISLADSAVKRM